MGEWVVLCPEREAPASGHVAEFDAAGVAVCLANVDGELHAMDNWCPHRRGPMGQGWVEGKAVVCPWHCWAFSVDTGHAEPPEDAVIAVFATRVEAGSVLVQLG